MSWWRLYTERAVPLALQEELPALVPGAWVRGGVVTAHDNCAWLTQRVLEQHCGRVVFEKLPVRYKPRWTFAPELRTSAPPLFPYQRRVLEGCHPQDAVLLKAGTGSGKSRMGISLALQQPGRVIWVTRAVSRLGHAREVLKWSTCHPQVIEGLAPFTVDPNARFFILGWETLPAHWPALVELRPSTVVLDESHRAKQSRRFSAVPTESGDLQFVPTNNISYSAMRLVRAKSVTRRILMSATFLKNRVRDLFSQLDLLQPLAWGRRHDWHVRYAGRRETLFGGFDDNGATNIKELRQRLDLIVTRVSKEESHASLPPMRIEVTRIPSSELITLSDRAAAKVVAGRGPFEAKLALSSVRKRGVIKELACEALAEGQKVCVFVGRRAEAVELARVLDRATDASVTVVHGGMGARQRDEAAQAYVNAEGAACLVATGDSMGEAFDGLQCTQLALLAWFPWTPAQLVQWLGRFQRHGQRSAVLINFLVAEGGTDDTVASMLLEKLPPVEELFDDETMADLREVLRGGKTEQEFEADLMAQVLGRSA